MKIAIDPGAYVPARAYPWDAGLDIRAKDGKTVPAKGWAVFDSGVHVEIPLGFAGLLKSKSGLNVNHHITSEGVIDYGYTGSIRVKLYNHGTEDYEVQEGDKISQLVIVPVSVWDLELVDSLEPSARGNNGFGSTGR